MALHRSVVNDVDILCELCVNTYSNVSDNCENEIWTVTVTSFQLPYVNYCDIVT